MISKWLHRLRVRLDPYCNERCAETLERDFQAYKAGTSASGRHAKRIEARRKERGAPFPSYETWRKQNGLGPDT